MMSTSSIYLLSTQYAYTFSRYSYPTYAYFLTIFLPHVAFLYHNPIVYYQHYMPSLTTLEQSVLSHTILILLSNSNQYSTIEDTSYQHNTALNYPPHIL